MLAITPVHPEGPRYRASIVYLSGLWVAPRVWLHTATYLGHRGWEGVLLDTRAIPGGLAPRVDAVVAHVRSSSVPVILVGHDAGAVVALAVASRVEVCALVLVAPIVPGAQGTHAVTWSRSLVWSLLRRRRLGPPSGRVGDTFFAELPAAARLAAAAEDARFLAHLSRRRRLERPSVMPPTLVVHGERDPLLSVPEARALAGDVGADLRLIPRAGHWLVSAPASHECVRHVHRWLVQRLGEPLLELHAEAMAEREDGTDER